MLRQETFQLRDSIIGIFAMHMMEKGPIYGSDVANRISELTDKTWRPGAGAIYPTLLRLVRKGFVTFEQSGERKRYILTQKGKELIDKTKSSLVMGTKYTFAWRLVLDMINPEDRPAFILRRFQSGIDVLIKALNDESIVREERAYLAKQAFEEMQRSLRKLEKLIS
ncbi:MAG: PadR family transcriptional regulator [Nitrososphaerota archaeon]